MAQGSAQISGNDHSLLAGLGDDDHVIYPKGILGQSQRTSNFNNLSAQDMIPSLEIAVTVAADRYVKVSTGLIMNSDAAQTITAKIMEGVTQLQSIVHNYQAGSTDAPFSGAVILTPSTGAHTYFINLSTSTSTADLIASSTSPAWILVEDIGSSL